MNIIENCILLEALTLLKNGKLITVDKNFSCLKLSPEGIQYFKMNFLNRIFFNQYYFKMEPKFISIEKATKILEKAIKTGVLRLQCKDIDYKKIVDQAILTVQEKISAQSEIVDITNLELGEKYNIEF